MPSEPKVTSFPVEAPMGKFALPLEVISGFPPHLCGGSVLTDTHKPWLGDPYLRSSLCSWKARLPLPPHPHAERLALRLPSPAHGSVLAFARLFSIALRWRLRAP